MGTTQRGNLYTQNADKEQKISFHAALHRELKSMIIKYKYEVSENQHILNIQNISDEFSLKYNSLFKNGRFRIGSAQKSLNLWLKYLWCLN